MTAPKRRWRVALVSIAFTPLTGCGVGGYNTYATPRTTPKGQTQGALFVQGVGFSGEVGKTSRRVIMPVMPSFGLRLGLADDIDVGAHFALTPASFEAGAEVEFGTDLRLQILHGEAMELAIDPGFRVARIANVPVSDVNGFMLDEAAAAFWTFDAPLVAGVNLPDSLSLVFSLGLLYGVRAPDVLVQAAAIEGRWLQGLAPRVGLGLHDDSGGFRLHPEVTLAFSTQEGARRVIYTIGVAFELWAKPRQRRPSSPE